MNVNVNCLTNGSSLEDCFTNTFALADLGNIKWRGFCINSEVINNQNHDTLDCPILSSYIKCLNKDILCVWRRVINNNATPVKEQVNSRFYSKQLWCFWFNCEPEWKTMIHKDLIIYEQGDYDHGLSYECRTLLFKAYHNLIEQSLISIGFAKLGKFFIYPIDQQQQQTNSSSLFTSFNHHNSKSTNHDNFSNFSKSLQQTISLVANSNKLACSFNFFIHGENTVCCIIDVRLKNPIYKLTKSHLTNAQHQQQQIDVILSPFGLSAVVTGNTFKESDNQVQKLINDWRKFFPTIQQSPPQSKDKQFKTNSLISPFQLETLEDSFNSINNNKQSSSNNQHASQMPTVLIEVIVAGIKMKYPSNFVYMLEPNESLLTKKRSIELSGSNDLNSNSLSNKESSNKKQMIEFNNVQDLLYTPKPLNQLKDNQLDKNYFKISPCQPQLPTLSFCIRSNLSQEVNCLSTSTPNNEDLNVCDVTVKVACNCSRCKPKKSQKEQLNNNLKSRGNEKENKQTSLVKFNIPFHRRNFLINNFSNYDLDSTCKLTIDDKNALANKTTAINNSNETTKPIQPNYFGKTTESPINNKQQSNKSIASSENKFEEMFSPYSGGDKSNSPINHQQAIEWTTSFQPQNHKHQNQQPITVSNFNYSNNFYLKKQFRSQTGAIKRPLLPAESHLNVNISQQNTMSKLYDFESINCMNWDLPAPEINKHQRTIRGCLNDNYQMNSDFNDENDLRDPYEFDDESILRNRANAKKQQQSIQSASDDNQIKQQPDDVNIPYVLDRMFDSDESNDNFSVPTTGTISVNGKPNNNNNNSSSTILSDIARMFPTPPSLEQNTVPSPYSSFVNSDSNVNEDLLPLSPLDSNNAKDQAACVYSTPAQTQFIFPAKYSPLSNISISNLKIPEECNYKSKLEQQKAKTKSNLNNNKLNAILPPEPSKPSNNNSKDKKDKKLNGYKVIESSSDKNKADDKSSLAINNSLIPSSSMKNHSKLSTFYSSNSSPQSTSNLPEINSLIVTLVLSDSMLNIHKDHNFDSCPLCICNMNIKGGDIDIYLPENLVPNDEPQYKCSCGFSAIQNRHRSSFTGLFYEDEYDITKICYDPLERLEKPAIERFNDFDPKIIDLLKSQCSVIYSSSSLLAKSLYYELFKKNTCESSLNLKLEDDDDSHNMPILLSNLNKLVSKRIFLHRKNALLRSDCCEVTFLALMLGKQNLEGFPTKSILQKYNQIENIKKRKEDCMHEWIFDNGTVHSNNHEVVQFLKNMQTVLQETVQRRLKDLGGTINVKNLFKLLTWRELYKLTGRSEDQSEPQPIPSLLVAHDRDWIALSPFALKYWKECSLEPYSFTRDIGYIVICPDTSYIVNGVKSFFKDLSAVYQMLKLGKHKPIYKVSKDGILTVKLKNSNLKEEYSSDNNSNSNKSSIASKLRMYAQVCKQFSQDYLKNLTLDKSIFEHHLNVKNNPNQNVNQENGANKNSVASPLNNANNTNETINGLDNKQQQHQNANEESGANQDQHHQTNSNATSHEANLDTDDDIKQPHIVIYIIEPFTFTNLDEETYRQSCLGLLSCYLQMIENLSDNLKNNINLQIVSLDSILQSGKDLQKSTRYDQFKSLAFSVFNQCRKVLVHQTISKSLTGFGPAASLEGFLKSKDPSITNISKVYMPPFILAPLKDKQTELGEMFGDRSERSQILFAGYCLTEDQKFIVVTCCNEKGDLVENSLINIQIENRPKHKKANITRYALQKLMDFLISVMSESTQPWRLVLCKIGRVGHCELKEWAILLSKRNLVKFSKQLKEKCKQCSYLANNEMPSILSACLTSLEPDTNLRVFADQFIEGENSTLNSCQLSTPEDATTTHILVFPTSSTTQSSQGNFQNDPLGNSLAEDDMLGVHLLGVGEDDLGVDDIFNWGSPGSPGRDQTNQLDSPKNAFDNGTLRNLDNEMEEQCQLLQQPLSLGYYVSTAKTGKLPKWFWSSCSHLENCNPSFLKSALLIHTPSVHLVNDDLYTTSSSKSSHPLDSHITTDVLRYVLENYNSLSWLVLDPSTHDRMSCLPLHIQLLMQFYHTVQSLF